MIAFKDYIVLGIEEKQSLGSQMSICRLSGSALEESSLNPHTFVEMQIVMQEATGKHPIGF